MNNYKKKVLKLDKNQTYKLLVKTSFNNTRVALIKDGNVIRQMSAGFLKIKGTQESTPYAAEKLTEMFMNEIFHAGARIFNIYMSGVGLGRSAVIRRIQEFINSTRDKSTAMTVHYIKDITPHRHNTTKHA